MAKIRMANTIDTVRGAFAGVSWRVRRGSGTIAANGGRRQSSSPAQNAYRRIFGAVVKGWGALTETQREAWNTWADAYGTTADPSAAVEASGRSRFIGANTMRELAGLTQIVEPDSPGIGNAMPALVLITPGPDPDQITVTMLEAYPPPVLGPATALIYASPVQPGCSPSNKNRWRLLGSFDVTAGGPGVSGAAEVFDLPNTLGQGQMAWFKTRVVTEAGNTSSIAPWPVLMPALGRVRAFRMGPVFDFLSPQHFEIDGTDMVFRFEVGTTSEFELIYDLSTASLDTLGELFTRINADGLWRAVDENADVSGSASVLLPTTPPTPVTTGQQPALLTIPE